MRKKVIMILSISLGLLIIVTLLVNMTMKTLFYNPIKDRLRYNTEMKCFEILAEMLGQGAELSSKGELKSQGFGAYKEKLVLKKAG